jgi:hypothetical protein
MIEMTLNTERASFVCIVSQVFNLNDYEVCQLETIVDKYMKSADKDFRIDSSKINLEVVTFGALLWLKPELDMQKVHTFMETLYPDSEKISVNPAIITKMERAFRLIPQMQATMQARYRNLDSIVCTRSAALQIKFNFDGMTVDFEGLKCGQDASIEEPDPELMEKVAKELFP